MMPIGLTMGEPAGIGGEIALQAWQRRSDGVPPFVLLDDAERVSALARGLGWAVPIRTVSGPEEALAVFANALPVLPVALPNPVLPAPPAPPTAPPLIPP